MATTDTPDQDIRQQLAQILQQSFPAAPPLDDAALDGALRALYQEHGPALAAAGLPPLPKLPPVPVPPPTFAPAAAPAATTTSYPLYVANAMHHRVHAMTNPDLGSNSGAPFESNFIGHLPMVRVPLPPMFAVGANPKIETPIGDVYLSSDHLVGSVELVTQKYGSQLGYAPGRVDLITPARTGITRSRFGAIAVYLGYRNVKDTQPSFYLLEAGLATGEAKMLYFGATMTTTITQRSGYVPTAYSSADNTYVGNLVVQNDQPVSLQVQAFPPGAPFYIQVSVSYQATTSTSNDPFELLIEAAMRIALIGQRMGQASGVPLEGLMADLALKLPWLAEPAYGGAGTITRAAALETV